VLLYAFLILWCLRFVGKTKNRSGSILTVGIVAILTSQIVINIGMVIGLLPVVGMPLPFMSYGGSAMLSHMIGIGLILNVHMRRYDI
jgi:rod shape determining protein RodA